MRSSGPRRMPRIASIPLLPFRLKVDFQAKVGTLAGNHHWPPATGCLADHAEVWFGVVEQSAIAAERRCDRPRAECE